MKITHTKTHILKIQQTPTWRKVAKRPVTPAQRCMPQKRKGISYMGKFSSDPFLRKSEKRKGKSNKGLKMAKKGRQKRKNEEMRSERRK